MASPSDFGIVSDDWKKVQEIDFYRKDYRQIGGKNGWQFDEALVEGLVQGILLGSGEMNACRLVSLPWKLYRRWFKIGERLAEHVYEESGVELSDEQQGYYYLYRQCSNALAGAELKPTIVVHEALCGNDTVSALQVKVALEFLARRNPREWERKSKVVLEQLKPDVEPIGSLSGGSREKKKVDDMQSVREARDKEIAKRRRRPGTLGDVDNEE